MDSVMKADSLPPDSSRDVLPYLRASFPLKSIQINSRFGMRNHPVKHKTIMHNGVDLTAHYEKVFSMFPGEVTGVGHDYRSGKYVTVKTAGYTISYCHLSAFWVSKGMFVNAGEVLGVSGSCATPSPKFRVENAVSPSGIIHAARSGTRFRHFNATMLAAIR